MKVTTEGERVIDLLWDMVAAKGFEKDTYFEMAARDIRGLPKLEGTVHVNMALVLKFMPSYLFDPAEYEPVPARPEPRTTSSSSSRARRAASARCLPRLARGLRAVLAVPNVACFTEQAEGVQRCSRPLRRRGTSRPTSTTC